MSFEQQIKAARLNAGMTQQQVADILEIDKSTYSGYETGKRSPDVEKIKALARAFGVSGDVLLELDDFDDTLEKRKAPLYSSEALKLAQDYDALPAAGQQMVRMVLDQEKRRAAEQPPQNEKGVS